MSPPDGTTTYRAQSGVISSHTAPITVDETYLPSIDQPHVPEIHNISTSTRCVTNDRTSFDDVDSILTSTGDVLLTNTSGQIVDNNVIKVQTSTTTYISEGERDD